MSESAKNVPIKFVNNSGVAVAVDMKTAAPTSWKSVQEIIVIKTANERWVVGSTTTDKLNKVFIGIAQNKPAEGKL